LTFHSPDFNDPAAITTDHAARKGRLDGTESRYGVIVRSEGLSVLRDTGVS
jgi:hypothetical protein